MINRLRSTKKILTFIWQWLWILTLPLTCVFCFWLFNTAKQYYEFGVRYNLSPGSFELHSVGKQEFHYMRRQVEVGLSGILEGTVRESTPLPVVNLYVAESNIAKLNSNLPHSGFNYVQGVMLENGKLQKISFRYRGDCIDHWGYRKKSIRIKTRKSTLYKGLRKFNLLAPTQFNTNFGCQLANEMDLLTPQTKFVEVVLNGKLMGTHVLVEQLEELTLRKNNLMPGDLYGGELERKDNYKGIIRYIFQVPLLWKKVAVNNHYPLESRKPLEALCHLVTAPDSIANHKELTEILDMKDWGRMAAFEILAQSFHYDDTHNWRLFYDPMRNRFIPIVWDPVAWIQRWLPLNATSAQLDVLPSEFHRKMCKNGEYLRMRALAIEAFFKSKQDETFLNRIDQILPAYKNAVRRDPFILVSEAEVFDSLNERLKAMKMVFASIKKGYCKVTKACDYAIKKTDANELVISLLVKERAPVHKINLLFENIVNGSVSCAIRYKCNGQEFTKDVSGALYVNGANLVIDKMLLPSFKQEATGNWHMIRRRLEVRPGYYEIIIRGVASSNSLINLSTVHMHSFLNQGVLKNSIKPSSFSDMYGIVISEPATEPLVWNGNKTISTTVVIDKPLIIKAGTTISLDANASLIFKNMVRAEGTRLNPIQFVKKEGSKSPWGTVALSEENANSSYFSYCNFTGGSGLKNPLAEYTAMFSIHNVKNVKVEHCIFRDSKITDDMVHVVYSDITFANCLFERAAYDALDIDISNAVISQCRFLNSGNDAVDMMTSTVVFIDSAIARSQDKGISVGEGSRLLAINSIVSSSKIGIQSKDASTVSLYNIELDGNGLALNAFKKNWRYGGGGRIFMYYSKIMNSPGTVSVTFDKDSMIQVFNDSNPIHKIKTMSELKRVYTASINPSLCGASIQGEE